MTPTQNAIRPESGGIFRRSDTGVRGRKFVSTSTVHQMLAYSTRQLRCAFAVHEPLGSCHGAVSRLCRPDFNFKTSHTGGMLQEEDAVEIYWQKISSIAGFHGYSKEMEKSSLRRERLNLSGKFGVTIRAIRDIWTRRTWAYATMHLWIYEDTVIPEVFNVPGASKLQVLNDNIA